MLKEGLHGRLYTEANINFLIEEIVVTHLIRQGLIDFPKTLVKNDRFRLIIYPGEYLKADIYQWKKGILPHIQNSKNRMGDVDYTDICLAALVTGIFCIFSY